MSDTGYDLGDVATLSATFTVGGVLTDPTTVTARVRKPDGTTTDYAVPPIVHDSAGKYHLNVTVDLAGDWTYKFVGTGAAAEVVQDGFYVRPDLTAGNSGRDLCNLRDVFRYVPGFDPSDVTNDETIDTLLGLITSESRSMHQEVGREFVAITAGSSTRTFDLTAGVCSRRQLRIGDAAAITAVELFDYDGATSLGVIAANLYVLKPRTRQEWEPIRRIQFPYRPITAPVRLAPGRTLAVTGTWGFPLIPRDLREACAKRVIVRYVSDSAGAGTELSDAIAQGGDINVGALLRSSQIALKGYGGAPFA